MTANASVGSTSRAISPMAVKTRTGAESRAPSTTRRVGTPLGGHTGKVARRTKLPRRGGALSDHACVRHHEAERWMEALTASPWRAAWAPRRAGVPSRRDASAEASGRADTPTPQEEQRQQRERARRTRSADVAALAAVLGRIGLLRRRAALVHVAV